jgi:TRAP-type uncharacterized transport system substrate-binding protein
MPEPLPRGANFVRAKLLWEIGLHIAGNPLTPYTGPRDVCITVGSGSGEHYRPWLRMSSGSPILAHAVAHKELEMAIVNPAGLLTQAYRGTGLFAKPLPVRVIATYPSWDRFVVLVHPRTGIQSLAEIKAKKMALRLSVREDPTHSTRVLIDQLFGLYGFSLAECESWGCTLQTNGPPADKRRLDGLSEGSIDVALDEGINIWLDHALACGMRPLTLEDHVFKALGDIGWRRVVMPKGIYPHLKEPYACIDYSGWPLYAHALLPDDDAYKVVDAIKAREAEIAWEADKPWAVRRGIADLGEETESTPRDVPLHPGAARWFREHGFKV